MTIKNKYPLPRIDMLFDQLSKAKYFTKLDVRWGYNNVRIKKGDEWKAVFHTPRGLYEPLVMFFGLTNSPSTFQTMMNELFKELIDEGSVTIYINDILVFTKDLDTHRQLVSRMLQILKDNNLYLKPDKCDFEEITVEYLGVVISEGQIRMDPIKVQGVLEWPTPKSKKEVQRFLGFCNFYRRFIQDYAKIAKPLSNLTGKAAWSWQQPQDDTFNGLKD
jgi:hypothetical protein